VRTEFAALASAWAESNEVAVLSPPNAPTNLGGPAIRDATEDVTWTWRHNPVDSSPQEAFQIRHRIAEDSFTTEDPVASSVSAWVLPGGTYSNPDTIEWQVRTKGQHDDYSPWSAVATSPTSTRPTVLINTPADESTVGSSTLTVEWGYAQAEASPQAGWTVELYDDADVLVETRSGSGTDTSAALATVLPDDTTWTVRVRVQSAAGLFSQWDEATFAVAYPLPPVPVVAVEWDADTATTAVTVTVPDPEEGEVAADHVDVYRAIDDGPFDLIATGVPLGSVVTDYAPTVAGTNRYRADAVSDLPSVQTSTIVDLVTPQPGDEASVWLSGGPGFSQACRLSSNIQITPSADRAVRVLHRFAERDDPVEFTSAGTYTSWSVSGDVISTSVRPGSPAQEWLDLARLPGPFLLRAPVLGGLYEYVSVSGITTPRGTGGIVTEIRFTATRVARA